MKKLIFTLSALLFLSCQQTMDSDVIGVVKMSDEKTNTILTELNNYLSYGTDSYDVEITSNLISDDLAGNFPGTELNAETFIATAEIHNSLFDNIEMSLPGDDAGWGGLQTVYYDGLGTWSHYWGTWTATGKFTGNEISQFIHLNWGWNDEGKVAFFNAQFDAGFFRDELEAAEASE
jgi:hypothetical protein